ncbi:hypothetical protein Fmac_015158 [Flemingia macrophylla]|uniref:Uncharacterized protein n=1 Tax=Flemingia macrophylla TaxID=520843 RepID=A0ABD1MDS4_9FABA
MGNLRHLNIAAGVAAVVCNRRKDERYGDEELQNCSENEAFSRVYGKEHPGYVRGMGLGVSPSQVIGSSSRASSSTTSFESNEMIEQMQAEINSLKAQVAEVDVLK